MRDMRKVIVKKERDVIAYRELWHIGETLLKNGGGGVVSEVMPAGYGNQYAASLVFIAFSFEGYMNHAGAKVIPCWEDLEKKLNPLQKFNLICTFLNQKFPTGFDQKPLQTIKQLFNFRDTMAHGKTEILGPEITQRVLNENLDEYLGQELLTPWQQLIKTPDFILSAKNDVYEILEWLHDKLPEPKEAFMTFGMSQHSAEILNTPNGNE